MKVGGIKAYGFTIVEIVIVIVVLGILALILLLAFPGVQRQVRNTAMVAGAKEYYKAIEAYQSTAGEYPRPPDGFSNADRAACLGEDYEGGVCLIEDVLDPPEVTNKAWFDEKLRQINSHLPKLPVNVKWVSSGHNLEAGALYAYTEDVPDGSGYDQLLQIYGIDSATAVIAYYLEGNVESMCKVPGSKSHAFLVADGSTDRDITICVVPLGRVVEL